MAKAIKKGAGWAWWLIGAMLAVIFGVVGRATGAVRAVLYGVTRPPAMKLTIDQAGNATLTNTTAQPLSIDSYEIWSAGGNLSPAQGTGWRSLDDWVEFDPTTLMNELGTGVLSFGELSATASLLAEGSISSYAVFQADDPFSIGAPVAAVVDPVGVYDEPYGTDITFYYTIPSHVGDKYWGTLEIVPEPGTVCIFSGLLAGGVLTWPRRRQRT